MRLRRNNKTPVAADDDLTLDAILTICVNAFLEGGPDLDVANELMDIVLDAGPAYSKPAFFACCHACARLAGVVSVDNDGTDPKLIVEALIEELSDEYADAMG